MKYLTFGAQERDSYKLCILVNEIRKDEIERAYINPYGIDPNEVIVISLHQEPDKKKTSSAIMKAYITEELVPLFEDFQIQNVLIADGDYFKTFAGIVKIEAMIGYVLESKFGAAHVAYIPNYRTLFYDPVKVSTKIALGIKAMQAWMLGTYQAPGVDIIKFAEYPATVPEIANWLARLHTYPSLSCDIEGFGLKHYEAGIGTITFCWAKDQGIAFPVDILADPVHSWRVRNLLRRFFENYEGTLVYHKIDFDVTVLIYQLFMAHLLDNEGLLYGLTVMLPKGRWHCTKLISYLATNSCSRNELSLKAQAQEYAGNYAVEEIKDIRKIPLPQLLQYNLVDGLATIHVFEKHWPTLISDQQLDIYESLFQPAIVDIVQMQLTGMPVNMTRVVEVKSILTSIFNDATARMQTNPRMQGFTYHLREEHVRKRNEKLKNKKINLSDPECDKIVFNPNSGPQLQSFLFEHLALPVLAYTDTKQPSTDGDTLETLLLHTQNPDVLGFLNALIDYKAVEKMLSSFIPALEGSQLGLDGWHYLFGHFNLGGTVSGRLSSSGPNLQNLPANVGVKLSPVLLEQLGDLISKYVVNGQLLLGKFIKSCFQAPHGWFFCGIDFSSLEDRISALTTKDPNKLKVYVDGYDGHAMRAVSYFGDQMPDIDPNNVNSVNSIAEKGHKYGPFRQESKVPTFLLTYGGTYIGIMQQLGWTMVKAKMVEDRYHQLYQVSDQWVANKLQEACLKGYVTVAFGLRVRTPLLHQTVLGTRKTPFEAEAEGRTAGNALGQSWCLLNSRAGSETMDKVRSSSFRNDIKPCAQIHDAQYFLVRDSIDAVCFANKTVVTACEWQDHPDIWHEEVKLGGEFAIFYPTWAEQVDLPNEASETEIYATFEAHVSKMKAA